MKSLLLVAHGSRLVSSNDAIKQLTFKLRERLGASGFDDVEYAFLELTKPSIPEGIAKLISQGSTDVVVLPYFLAPGTHVVDDVPELIDEARLKYPQVEFRVMTHLGAVDGMIDLILSTADVADWELSLKAKNKDENQTAVVDIDLEPEVQVGTTRKVLGVPTSGHAHSLSTPVPG